MSVKMRLGWWMDRGGDEWMIDGRDHALTHRWTTSKTKMLSWDDSGMSSLCGISDLIEFIRPLDEDLPPALNTAVKAAENMVRELERHHAALLNQANFASEILDKARKELERLEKECEVAK